MNPIIREKILESEAEANKIKAKKAKLEE